MDKLRFSIILCVKEGSKYLEDQLLSIINQDFLNWQLFIVDDNSIDDSFKIAKEFSKLDQRIIVKKNIHNQGILKNFLINAIKQNGEWIIFCDQDDIWKKNKLSTLDFFIKGNDGYNVFFHNGKYLISNDQINVKGAFGNYVKNNQIIYSNHQKIKFLNLFTSNKIIGCFSCVKKEFLRKYVVTIPLANIYHDHWIALIASLYSRIYFIDKELISYRRHSDCNTLKNSLFRILINRFLLIISLFINHFKIE